jgi:hypothetical protein
MNSPCSLPACGAKISCITCRLAASTFWWVRWTYLLLCPFRPTLLGSAMPLNTFMAVWVQGGLPCACLRYLPSVLYGWNLGSLLYLPGHLGRSLLYNISTSFIPLECGCFLPLTLPWNSCLLPCHRSGAICACISDITFLLYATCSIPPCLHMSALWSPVLLPDLPA